MKKADTPAIAHVLVTRSIAAPPAQGAPPAPAFEPLRVNDVRRLRKATATQYAGMPVVADEIANVKTFGDDFGKGAPDPALLASQLELAATWHAEATRARAWMRYAETQALVAADAAVRAMDAMGEELDHALLHDSTIAARYPQLAAFVRVRKDSAARGAATRRKNKAAKAA